MFPLFARSKTMIGRLLSMHREIAGASITLMFLCRTSMEVSSLNFLAFLWTRGSLSYTPATRVAFKMASALISIAPSAAAVSGVKYGLPVPAATMTPLPFARARWGSLVGPRCPAPPSGPPPTASAGCVGTPVFPRNLRLRGALPVSSAGGRGGVPPTPLRACSAPPGPPAPPPGVAIGADHPPDPRREGKAREPAERDLLADLRHLFVQHVGQGDSPVPGEEQRIRNVLRVLPVHSRGDPPHELLEVFGLGDEVGLAIHLDERRRPRRDMGRDDPFGCDPGRLLRRRSQTLLPQDIHRGLQAPPPFPAG